AHFCTRLPSSLSIPIFPRRKLRLRGAARPELVAERARTAVPKDLGSPLAACCAPFSTPSHPQVWFQNRRAKFRRNERAMLANRSASLLKSYSQEAAIEQPVVPRPATLSPDYLSWTASSPYSTVPPYSPGGSGPATPGVNMANSIASLRLKAKEFSLHHSQVPTVN
uniref:paired mesoderm homeobox protein 2-like n=1 Tax=Panthera onca TaxID=9690 RepID=UPI00295411FC